MVTCFSAATWAETENNAMVSGMFELLHKSLAKKEAKEFAKYTTAFYHPAYNKDVMAMLTDKSFVFPDKVEHDKTSLTMWHGKAKTKIEITDVESGEFQVNGQTLTMEANQDLGQLFNQILPVVSEDEVAIRDVNSIHFMGFFIPEANAQVQPEAVWIEEYLAQNATRTATTAAGVAPAQAPTLGAAYRQAGAATGQAVGQSVKAAGTAIGAAGKATGQAIAATGRAAGAGVAAGARLAGTEAVKVAGSAAAGVKGVAQGLWAGSRAGIAGLVASGIYSAAMNNRMEQNSKAVAAALKACRDDATKGTAVKADNEDLAKLKRKIQAVRTHECGSSLTLQFAFKNACEQAKGIESCIKDRKLTAAHIKAMNDKLKYDQRKNSGFRQWGLSGNAKNFQESGFESNRSTQSVEQE